MTLRTLTKKQNYALVYFDIDNTYSIVDSKKITDIASVIREKGSVVNVKCGAVTYKGEIIALHGKYFKNLTSSRSRLFLIKFSKYFSDQKEVLERTLLEVPVPEDREDEVILENPEPKKKKKKKRTDAPKKIRQEGCKY